MQVRVKGKKMDVICDYISHLYLFYTRGIEEYTVDILNPSDNNVSHSDGLECFL